MKFPLSWLADYVPITVSVEDLSHKLTMAGLEVEGIESIGQDLCHIITAKIESIDPHPNADKLVITQCFDGKKRHQIVTGATNINVGNIVPISLPGAVLASGLKIKSSKLRGVDSHGMLCSEQECGVAEQSEGIWILADDTPLGVDFIQHAYLQDSILDIAILPNRGDCQSMLGLAREIAALIGESFTPPKFDLRPTAIAHSFSVKSETEKCPLYIGRYISGITPTPTPLWMKRRLELAGLRSISLSVDITNYVLLETGQPLHAFDDALCRDKNIVITESSGKKNITTLDGQSRSISKGQLLIQTGKTPVAIAGIMGAANTEVSEKTQAIFLESAYFEPTSIRRSGTNLGLRTDSAIRFEKGVSIDGVDYASQRAAYLFQSLANAYVSKLVPQSKQTKHSVFKPKTLPFSSKQINAFLGTDFTTSQMLKILKTLGFTIDAKDMLTVPVWRRHDIQEWPCIAEEIIRIIGFDTIPTTKRTLHPTQDPIDPLLKLMNTAQDFCVANGFNELNTYPLIASDDLKHLNLGEAADWNSLSNPISPLLAHMRPSLLPSFLQNISYHHSRNMMDLALFEVGRGFEQNKETTYLSIAITGNYHAHSSNDAQRACSSAQFSQLQNIIMRFTQQLSLPNLTIDSSPVPKHCHPKQYQSLLLNKQPVGYIAHIHPNACDHYDISEPVIYAELSLSALAETSSPPTRYTPFSRFPAIRRDIALLVPHSVSYDDILSVIKSRKHKSVQDIGVFDVFQSEKLGSDKRSIGIYLMYQDLNKSLEDEKVNKSHERLCQFLTDSLPVEIR